MASVLQLAPRIWTGPVDRRPDALPAADLYLAQMDSAAFGDGRHPTTRLCAGAMDVVLRARRIEAVLDVGTGTGVLARIARARGIPKVVATDIDPTALEAARAHFALDAGGRPAIELTDRSPDYWGSSFDLVVANLLEAPLRAMASRLTEALAPGGTLMISGFTPPQTPSLRHAFLKCGLRFDTEARLEGWALATFFRRGRHRPAKQSAPSP